MAPENQSRPEPSSLFSTMARIRAFEERVARHFRDGDIHGFVHLSIGGEAVAAGACAALERDDVITTSHRGHGHCLAKGADPVGMMAELFGRATGLCGGKGGSMHIADPSVGILGANGIVGAGIPLAVGAGLTSKLRDTGGVAVAFFGEGAVHCGAFHEAITLAVAWAVPVIFICENNGYAEFTRSGSWGGPEPRERAASYGLAADSVDGTDAIAVSDAVSAAVADRRPFFLEARTTRLHGHYEGDPQEYRTAEELELMAERDPLRVLRARLADADDDANADVDVDVDVEGIERAAQEEMDRAVAAALAAPYPDAGGVLEDVYA